MPIDKVIVSNASALREKYGRAGYIKISTAIKRLVDADAKRGLISKFIALDSTAGMEKYHTQVASASHARAAKWAIDAIYAREKPGYILILGADDVVPLVQLKNPVYSPKPNEDNDETVPSDLPYACDTGYSTDINRFVGPTRVVGRLPDLVGARNPQYLLKLLRIAANYKTRNAASYQKYFGLSARIWETSTSRSLTNVFGNSTSVSTTPSSVPPWPAITLAPRLHFINCHGGKENTNYYGQRKGQDASNLSIAHSAYDLPKKIVNGTVLAAECCYGAALYNPTRTEGQAGIAYTYLGEEAYGVFGSTTIAYGSASSNSSADLICQYFMLSVMNGASLGRATLEARQQFAGQFSHLSPFDLKTLAQFYLLGDPSIHAAAIAPHGLNKTNTFKTAFAESKDTGPRTLRRERLHRVGTSLQNDLPTTYKSPTEVGVEPSPEISRILGESARESGLGEYTSMHFHVTPKRRGWRKLFQPAETKRTIHLLMGSTNRENPENDQIKKIVAIIATAENGKLMHLRRLHSR